MLVILPYVHSATSTIIEKHSFSPSIHNDISQF